MDEEYTECVGTADDLEVSEDISADIPNDIPEDVPEEEGIPGEDYSDVDVSDEFEEDISEAGMEERFDSVESAESIDEDIVAEPEDEEMESALELEEDFLEDGGELTDSVEDIAENVAENEDIPEINSVSDYMNAHNYGRDDFVTYSQDPQWRNLMRKEFPDYKLPELSQESANAQLSQYMNAHNYGIDDYDKYSQDPTWRELHTAAFPDNELPPLNDDYPDDIATGELFGSFETDQHMNGSDVFVKGDNYEQFKKDYYSSEESAYEAYDEPKEIDISPSMIEGIHIGEKEMEDPSVFWSQHENGGTMDSFKQIADHIPDVREQLSAGKTMDELLADPELSECAGIYFANKPKVIEHGDYYEFDSNGRHRILAAREAGYDIPVEIIGHRGMKEEL